MRDTTQGTPEDGHTNGKRVSLHPLRFEDALRGLLKTKPPDITEDAARAKPPQVGRLPEHA